MPAISRKGDKSTGHDKCPGVEAVEGADDFLVKGMPVVLEGYKYAPHGCENHQIHQGTLAGGSPAFTIHGRAVGRIGDPISCGGTIAEGASFFRVGNGNEQKVNKAICKRNEAVTRYKRSRDEDIFYCLPAIAEHYGNNDFFEKDKKGWFYLRDMFYKWLSGNANTDAKSNPNPFWVDIDWVLDFFIAETIWNTYIPLYVVNEHAIESLISILTRNEYLTKQNKEFDFINTPWQMWQPYYHQHIALNGVIGGLLSGLYAALGEFTIRFLTKGQIEYLGNSQYKLIINQVAGFVYDLFNFEGDQGFGYWSCKKKQINIDKDKYDDTFKEISNAKFREFREHNELGNDFLVLSQPKIIDNFSQFIYYFIYDN